MKKLIVIAGLMLASVIACTKEVEVEKIVYREDTTITNGLKNQITSLESQINNLQNQLSAVQSALTESQEFNNSLQNSNESLEAELAAASTEIASLTLELETLEQTIVALNADIDTLNNSLEISEAEIAELEESLANAEAQVVYITETVVEYVTVYVEVEAEEEEEEEEEEEVEPLGNTTYAYVINEDKTLAYKQEDSSIAYVYDVFLDGYRHTINNYTPVTTDDVFTVLHYNNGDIVLKITDRFDGYDEEVVTITTPVLSYIDLEMIIWVLDRNLDRPYAGTNATISLIEILNGNKIQFETTGWWKDDFDDDDIVLIRDRVGDESKWRWVYGRLSNTSGKKATVDIIWSYKLDEFEEIDHIGYIK